MEVQTPHQPGVTPTEFPMENFNQSVIKHKTGLLNLAAELGNVSKAYRIWAFLGIPFAAIRRLGMRVGWKPSLGVVAESRT